MLTLCALLAAAGGLLPAPPAFAASCSGIAVGVASAVVPPGQTANLAITASGVPAPGVAGFRLSVAYDPSAVTVLAAQAGAGFSSAASDVSQPGTVAVAAASAQGSPGSPVLAVLSVRAAGAAGQSTTLTITRVELVDPGLNPVAACPEAGTLTVAGAAAATLQITSTLLPAGLVGAFYSQTLTAVGGTGTYTWSLASGSLPPGLSLQAATGEIYGTPTTTGPTSFTVQGSDGAGHTASQALQLLINPAGATLAVATTALPGGSVGAAYSSMLSATGGTGPYTWSLASGALPAGLNLDGATGKITGTPTTPGPASFTVRAGDSSSPTELATEPLTIVVAPASVTVVTTVTSSTTSASSPVVASLPTTDTTATAAGGTGTVTTSQYSGDPQPAAAAAFQTGSTYFDVDVAPQSAFQTLTIQQCGLSSAETLYWWDGSAWVAVAPQSYAAGCVSATLDTTGTSPTIAELTGTPFAVAAASGARNPITQPVAATVGAPGGKLRTTDGAFSMTVPAGAVQGTLSLSESASAPNGLPTGMTAASPIFFLTGAPLASPLPATITYTAAALNSLPLTRLSVYEQNAAGGWTFLPSKVEAATGSVSAQISGPSTLVVLAATQTFPDVASAYWAAPDVDVLLAAGVGGGFPDGTFRPEATLTRAEFVKMMTLALSLTPGGAVYFDDVAPTDWFAPYVSAAVRAGLVQGTSPTTFSSNAPVTREQLAVLLARALKLTASAQLGFKDASAVDAWAVTGVQAAVAAGYMTGYPDGTFQPQAPTTRAQAAKVLAAVIAHLAP